MSEELIVNDPFAEDAHLDLSSGPKHFADQNDEVVLDTLPEVIEEVETVNEPPAPKTYDFGNGCTAVVQKTDRGWEATLDTGTSRQPEKFYGATKDGLLESLMKAKVNATSKISELSRQTKLNIVEDGPENETDEQINEENIVEGILKEFVLSTPDYSVTNNNYQAMMAWMVKYKLGKRLQNIDLALPALYKGGVLTAHNLSLAWQALKAEPEGLVDIKQPESSEPEPNRNVTERRPRGAGLGIRSRETTMQPRATQTEITRVTEADLEKLSDQDIKDLYQGVLRMARDPKTRPLVDAAIARHREKNR